MAIIKAACDRCGQIELAPEDIELRLCRHAPAASFAFKCPHCGEVVQKPADDRVIQILIAGGVRTKMWELPAEIWERHEGVPLTHDDLLDFHLLLEQPDWFEKLFRVASGS